MASSPPKAERRRPSTSDTIVAGKLDEAIARIRMLELTLGFCGLLVGLLVYAQVFAVLDVRLELPAVVRQLCLALFLVAAGVWSYLFLYRPLRLGINPYYAARLLEENTPGTQNGALNWLDLKDSPDASHARPLVGQRAAKELSKADLEKAISGERAAWAGGLALGLFVFLFILGLLVGASGFIRSLGRVLFPYTFASSPLVPTGITIVRPEGGDGTLLVGQAATVTVELEGGIPRPGDATAPKIRYRHTPNEPWLERPLAPLDTPRTWEVVVPPTDVENGISYQVVAGAIATPLHRIDVVAAPLIVDFRATYHFRQYTGRTIEVRRERPIEALQGTVVKLVVKTNRTLAAGTPQLDLDVPSGRRVIPGTILADDPTAFEAGLTLEETGTYRIRFGSASTLRDIYTDSQAYPLVAVPDEVPEVELTHPARDVVIPANGLLPLKGWATDTEGLKSLTLRLRVLEGGKLQPQVYRGLDTLRQKNGFYPTQVDYLDAIDLTKLREENGKVFTPQAGQKIEYWLEAADACDLPGAPHVAASKRYLIEVGEPDGDKDGQGQQRKQAARDQAEHAREQDQQFAEEDAARKQENDARAEQGKQGGNEGNQGENAGNQGNQGNQGGNNEQKNQDADTLNQAEQLKNALDKKQPDQPGEGKGQDKEQGGESKEGGEQKENKGESKPGANGEQKEQAGQGKEQGQGMNAGGQEAERKDGQQGQGGMGENKPEGKEGGQQGQGMNQPQAAEGKQGEQPGDKPGQARDQKPGQGQGSERKEGPDTMAQEGGAQGKENGGMGREAAGEQKTPPQPSGQPSEKKEGGERSNVPAPPSGKEQGQPGEQQPGERKEGPGQQGPSQGTSKPGANAQDLKDPKKARPEDVERLKDQAGEPSKERAEAAGKELDRIQKEANDPEVREAARQALEQLKKPAAGECKKPGGGAGMGQGMAQGGAENKPGAAEPDKAGAGAKPEAGMGQKAGGQAEAKEQGPEGMGGMGGNPMPAENGPVGKDAGNVPAGGNAPGMGLERTGGDPPGGNGPGEGNNNPANPNPAAPAPATELQLQKFKDAVTPDVLKDLRMTPEEFDRFLKRYEELARRTGHTTDKPPLSRPGTGTLPSMAGGQNTPTSPNPTQPGGPGTVNRPQAPPGYREAHREFLRRISQPDR